MKTPEIHRTSGIEIMNRDQRQADVLAWAHNRFDDIPGVDVGALGERGRRFLEEAGELVQARGMTKDEALKVMEYVFSREAGNVIQEYGGVAVTLMAMAQADQLSLAEAEAAECRRIAALDRDHFQRRQIEKRDAGL